MKHLLWCALEAITTDLSLKCERHNIADLIIKCERHNIADLMRLEVLIMVKC